MHLNLNISNQSDTIEYTLKRVLYRESNRVCQKSGGARFLGPIVGAASGLIEVARRVALICENMIKGIGNILGTLFFAEYNLQTGLSQLLVRAPLHLVILPFTCISAALSIISHTIYMVLNPIKYTNQQWCLNDPIERQVQARREHEAQLQTEAAQLEAQRNAFNQITHFLSQNPQNAEALKTMAAYYTGGIGVQKNEKEGFLYFIKAAQQGDVFSMTTIARYYREGFLTPKNDFESFYWSKKAADLGDINSMCLVGFHYSLAQGIEKNDSEAVRYLYLAAQRGQTDAMFHLGTKVALNQGAVRDYKVAAYWFRQASQAGHQQSIPFLIALLNKCNDLEIYPFERSDWMLKCGKLSDFVEANRILFPTYSL